MSVEVENLFAEQNATLDSFNPCAINGQLYPEERNGVAATSARLHFVACNQRSHIDLGFLTLFDSIR